MYIPLAQIIDFEKERERLTKERDGVLAEIARVEGKLANENFIAKAPEKVVAGEREKLQKYRDTLAGIEQALAKLK